MIRVLLADDHSIVRGGLARIVEESGDIEVVAEAVNGLDGELIGLDGRFLQVRSDGSVQVLGDEVRVPFATVTFFAVA